jgi:hypothetical protein
VGLFSEQITIDLLAGGVHPTKVVFEAAQSTLAVFLLCLVVFQPSELINELVEEFPRIRRLAAI